MPDSIQLNFLIVIGLIIFAALVSCFETAITAASRARIHRLASNGSGRARNLEILLNQREKVISVMLLANNVINIIASALTTSLLLGIFGEIGVVYATIFLTVVVIVFGEILPKTIAIKSPENVALFFSYPIWFLFKIFAPVVFVIQKIVDFSIGLFFTKEEKNPDEDNLEEIRDTVDLKAKEGTIFKYDKDLLDGVLDLSDTEISEIMVHRKNINSVNVDLPVKEILKQVTELNYTRIPLWRGNKDNIVAVLNVRKVLRALYLYNGDVDKFDLKVATSEPWFVPSSNSLRSQLFTFRKKKKRFALVVDEYGTLVGMITLEDILEEIVGEIKEQDSTTGSNIIKTRSGAYKIGGSTLIRDINKRLNWSFEEGEDAYNLSTFIISNLGRIPDEREKILIGKYEIEVLKKRNNDLILLQTRDVSNL
jgi:Mg2+/Co2+ transporter CorB